MYSKVKLYGRHKQIESLQHAVNQSKNNICNLCVVRGAAGTGKSRLIRHVLESNQDPACLQAAVKFEQSENNQNTNAFHSIVEQTASYLLTKSSSYLDTLRSDVRHLVGTNLALLSSISESFGILFEQPAKSNEIPLSDAQKRFDHTVTSYLSYLLNNHSYSILFFDDIQWMDKGSAASLRYLLRASGDRNLMVVCGIRSEYDVDAIVQPLDFSPNLIQLNNLSPDETGSWLSDLYQDANTEELCQSLYRLTNGNPLFIERILLGPKKLQTTETRPIADLAAFLQEAPHQLASDDNTILNFLSTQIHRLSETELQHINAAACFGYIFTVNDIRFQETNDGEITRSISNACTLGLVKPLETMADEHEVRYQFVHDKIQQLLLDKLTSQELEEIYLRLGKSLLSEFDFCSDIPDNCFHQPGAVAKLNALNQAVARIDDESDIKILCMLNYKCAVHLKSSTSPESVFPYIFNAVTLFKKSWMDEHGEQFFSILLLATEIYCVTQRLDLAQELIHKALKHTDDEDYKSQLQKFLIIANTLAGDYEEALEIGRSALEPWGIDLPVHGLSQEVKRMLELGTQQISGNAIDSLVNSDSPVNASQLRNRLSLLSELLPATATIEPRLNDLIGIHLGLEATNDGFIPESAKAIANYACTIALVSSTDHGFGLGQKSEQLLANVDDPIIQCRVIFTFLTYLSHWGNPLPEIVDKCDDMIHRCLDCGDILYAGFFGGITKSSTLVFSNLPLLVVKAELTKSLQFCHENDNNLGKRLCISTLMGVENLIGNSTSSSIFSFEDFTEAQHIRTCEAESNFLGITQLRIFQALCFYLHGEHEQGFLALDSANKSLHDIGTTFPRAIARLLGCLLAVEMLRLKNNRHKYLNLYQACLDELKSWARTCPYNFEPMYYLAKSEKELYSGNLHESLDSLQRILNRESISQFSLLHALTHEKISKISNQLNWTHASRLHAAEAYKVYIAWGATRKANLILEQSEQKPWFEDPDAISRNFHQVMDRARSRPSSPGRSKDSPAFDTKKYTDIVSGDAESTSRMTESLLKFVSSTLNASAVVFLIDTAAGLRVQGRFSDEIVEIHDLPISDEATESLVPSSIIHYSVNTHLPLALENPHTLEHYRANPYFRTSKPSLVHSIPVVLDSRLVGMAYIEYMNPPGNFQQQSDFFTSLCYLSILPLAHTILEKSSTQKIKTLIREHEILIDSHAAKLQSLHKTIAEKSRLNIFVPEDISRLVVEDDYRKKMSLHRNQLAILFCDLRGFTSFSESVEAEEAIEMLNQYQKILERCIRPYKAIIDHRSGDGLMLFIGDPAVVENPASEAIKLAFELRSAICDMLDDSIFSTYKLGFGIGISYGYCTVGLVGDSRQLVYSATGRYVNLASRLCDAAEHKEILASVQTTTCANLDNLKWEVSSYRLKGFSDEVQAHSLLGLK